MQSRLIMSLCLSLALSIPAVVHAASAEKPLAFWHTQSAERGELLNKIVADYNATNPAIPVSAVFQGSYDDIYKKTKANLVAKTPPDMVVAYESYIRDFMRLYPVVDLEQFVKQPQTGLSQDELNDFFPIFLESNRYPDLGNRMLSFPFTKSLMTLFANNDLLKKAGFDQPAQTWDEFEKQCLAMKPIGKKGYAMDNDASTLDGMFMSRGATLLDDKNKTTNFDHPEVVETLDYLHRMVKEGAAYQIDGLRDEDVREFTDQNCAFFVRSCTRRPAVERDVAGKFNWSMNPLPAGKGQKPMTVLYGANICVLSSDVVRAQAAWDFIKYFTSPEVTARWAVGSGYLPVRRSSEKSKTMQDFFAAHPNNRQVFDMIPLGRLEPTPTGWQTIRTYIQQTATDAMIGRGGKSAGQLAKELKFRSNALLYPPTAQAGPTPNITAKILIGFLIALGVAFIARVLIRRHNRGNIGAS